MNKVLAVLSAVTCIIYLSGCNKAYPEENNHDELSDIAASKHMRAVINGLIEEPVTLELDSEKYIINENGLFEADAIDISTLHVLEQPKDSECVIFQGSDSPYKIQINCVSSDIKLSSDTTSVGHGWTYAIKGDIRVNYSFENITFADDNGSLTPVFNTNLVGTFYDDDGKGSEYDWVYPATPIGPNSKPGLDQALFELLTSLPWVYGISQTYQHEADLIITSEYTATLSKKFRAAEVIAMLAQSIYDASGGVKGNIEYVPLVRDDAAADDTYRISFSVWPYIGDEALYIVRVKPLSEMGVENHFPTPFLSNEN